MLYVCLLSSSSVSSSFSVGNLLVLVCRRVSEALTQKTVAMGIINRFGRCILARQRVLRAADVVFRRIWDEDTSSYYYGNVVTGETSWTRSKVYLSKEREPPVLRTEEVQESTGAAAVGAAEGSARGGAGGSGGGGVGGGGSNSSKKRSPRRNRV
jgi:uncharacterized membrane protein YgcG